MQVAAPYREALDVVLEAGGEPLKLCYQCGICTGSCPWNLVRSFIVRKMIHQAQLGLVDFESEDLWLCVTCGACVKRCPRGVEIVDIMRALRRTIVGLGMAKVPDSLNLAMKNVSGTGNPLGEAQEKRLDWASKLNVKRFAKGAELLYFPCCLNSYDPNEIGAAQATVRILEKAGVDYGVLGTEQTCCGEALRKAGNESLFRSLAEKNIATLRENGVVDIMVSSPHCYQALKNEYVALGGSFNIIHSTQYLSRLIDQGRIKPSIGPTMKVAYHDPCYLGRHNGIYDEPRKVLNSIPGLELVEFPDSREDSICCGGGAGRLWMDTKKQERFSDLRLQQAIDIGAKVLAVACPYCCCMFKDSVASGDKEGIIEIKDISELVLGAL